MEQQASHLIPSIYLAVIKSVVKVPVIKVGDANGVKNGYRGVREGYEAELML